MLFEPVENLYIDTAFFGNLCLPFDSLCKTFPANRILYGSLFPLQCPESILTAIEMSEIEKDIKEKILYINAEKLFNSGCLY